jgi:hypothetical protein
MHTLGVTKLYVTNDGGHYGAAIANAVRQAAAGSISIVGSLSGADGAFYGGSSPPAAARFLNQAAQSSPTMKLFAPSALDGPSLPANLAAAAHNLFVSAPGFLKQNLSPTGSKFVSDFTTAYGHAPASQAIFGYEAMSAVLAVLHKAGTAANNRSTVVSDFMSLRNRQSVLGSYSMSSSGDISIAPFVFSRIQQGKLVPFAQVQG